MAVLVGTSGWHYPGGRGTWNGVFYPRRRPARFDELAYYAEHFPAVEVNATFYRQPEASMSEAWLRRTPAAFQFAVKLFQKFTHPDMFLARHGVRDWNLSRADVDLFRRGVDPLATAGRLVAVLVQFPPSFHADSATEDYVTWLAQALTGYPLAFEWRHHSWEGRSMPPGAAIVVADDPTRPAESLTARLHAAATGPFLFVRMHGRNRAAWWDHAEAEDRYDYLYSARELQPVATAAGSAAQAGKRVAVFFNNHFSAKAAANAAVLSHQLGQIVPGIYLPEMVRRYPELEGVVTTSGLPL